MATIEPKDLAKGDWVMLSNGWLAEVKGKAKGIRIFLDVHGIAHEMGDVYTRDLQYRVELSRPGDVNSPIKLLNAIVLNDKHAKQFAAMGA